MSTANSFKGFCCKGEKGRGRGTQRGPIEKRAGPACAADGGGRPGRGLPERAPV